MGQTATKYINDQGYRFSCNTASLLERLGELSSCDQQFIDKLAQLDPSLQQKYALKFAFDGDIDQNELKQLPVAKKIPKNPTDLVQALVSRMRKEGWEDLLFGGTKRRYVWKYSMKMAKESADVYFDNPQEAIKMIDDFLEMYDNKKSN